MAQIQQEGRDGYLRETRAGDDQAHSHELRGARVDEEAHGGRRPEGQARTGQKKAERRTDGRVAQEHREGGG